MHPTVRNVVVLGGGLAPIRQVATRCRVTNAQTAIGSIQSMSRTSHIARDAISSIQVAIANWYVSSSSGLEIATGAAMTVAAAIEYPSGTFTRLPFAGSNSGAIADGATGFSDLTPIVIPNGAQFWTRIYRTIPASRLHASTLPTVVPYTAQGDAMTIGATVTDQTMGGTVTSSGTGAHMFPLAVLARTRKTSVLLIGDSRVAGSGDVYNGNGDTGILARTIGATLPYINLGVSGDKAALAGQIGNFAFRGALAAYCSSAIIALGINDCRNSGSAASINSGCDAVKAVLQGVNPNIKSFLTTIEPDTTSTDSWATLVNQTTLGGVKEAARLSVNATRRAGVVGYAGTLEIADVVESSRDSGLWIVNGTPSFYTADGLHETQAGYQLIVSSGAVPITGY